MIFNVPGHIQMIRNGLFRYDGIDQPDYSLKAMKKYHTHRAHFLAGIPGISKEVKAGLYPLIIKSQTRRPKRGVYQVETERKKPHKMGYAVQRKRAVKAEPDIRIIFDRIWEEKPQGFLAAEDDKMYPSEMIIPTESAWAEGGYTPREYEVVWAKLNPKWDGWSRWAFKFHVIEVQN